MARRAPEILEKWLARLDRRPTGFPAAVAALGGFGVAATALTHPSIPPAASFTTLARLAGPRR